MKGAAVSAPTSRSTPRRRGNALGVKCKQQQNAGRLAFLFDSIIARAAAERREAPEPPLTEHGSNQFQRVAAENDNVPNIGICH